jgi:hypothetical protein
MEKSSTESRSAVSSIEEVDLNSTARWARDRLAEHEKQREQDKLERQQGRLQGRPTKSLVEKLRACNIDQLKYAKKLCDRYMLDQRKPPARSDCGDRYTVKVIDAICVKNQHYQLEFRRSTRSAKKIYVNGPYIRAYHRDGAIIKITTFNKKLMLRDSPQLKQFVVG